MSVKFPVYLLHHNSDDILRSLGEYIFLFPPNIGDYIKVDMGFELDLAEVIYFRHDMCVDPKPLGLGLNDHPSASLFVRKARLKFLCN